ncbi:MAG: hypothetical protein AB7T63_10835 [Planctomycetota bacterium]
MRFALLVALVVVLSPQAPVRADGEMALSPWLDLTGAHVLASPDVPTALVDHLPEGRTPAALTWPLPADGPLLVLALPTRDDVAADVVEALGVWRPTDDLRGGYRIAAWQDGERAVAVVVADDAAALLAARFELQVVADRERLDPMMRTVELGMPAESGSTRVRTGRRDVLPVRAWRAWRGDVSTFAGPRPPRSTLRRMHLRLAGAHVNRVVAPTAAVPDTVRALEGSGVAVVVRVDVSPATLDRVTAEVMALARDHGIGEALVDARHFAGDPAPLLDALGAWPLEHVVVALPDAASRLRVLQAGLAARLPGAMLLVPARGVDPLEEEVLARARRSHVDIVLDEVWPAPSWASERLVPLPPPGLPRDRTDARGILVTGAFVAAVPLLETAWDGAPPPDPDEVLAQPLGAGSRLRDNALVRLGNILASYPVPGGAPWRSGLRSALARCNGVRTVLVPIVPLSPTVDGQLGEPAWAHAVAWPGADDTWVLSDGRRLFVAVRSAPEAGPRTLALDDASLRIAIDAAAKHVSIKSPTRSMLVGLGLDLPAAEVAWRGSTLEIALDRFDLGVDAQRGQVFGPFDAPDGAPACLVVLP